MSVPYLLTVATENTPYMAWQTQLFCCSAMKHLGVLPIVVVHLLSDEQLLPELKSVKRMGCEVVVCKSYAKHPLGMYKARNEIGSLMELSRIVGSEDQSVLFCEADFIFRDVPYYSEGFAAERYGYLDYTEKRIIATLAKLNVQIDPAMLNQQYKIGVPYVLPCASIGFLASEWLRVMDEFVELGWIDIMYAFGIAAAINGIAFESTSLVNHNYSPRKAATRPMIHYCYGDEEWSKRNFMNESALTSKIFHSFPEASIGKEIVDQLSQAAEFFGSMATE